MASLTDTSRVLLIRKWLPIGLTGPVLARLVDTSS